MSSRYAEGTSVSADRSMSEIRATLNRYGADQFYYGEDRGIHIFLAFRINRIQVRFTVPLPDPDSDDFLLTPSKKWARNEKQGKDAYDQEVRRIWRSIGLYIKATLEAVALGIITLEEAFLAHMVLPSGETVGAQLIPNLQQAIQSGQIPPMLGQGR